MGGWKSRERGLGCVCVCACTCLANTSFDGTITDHLTRLSRYRWHIKLLVYDAFHGGPSTRRLYLQPDRWAYDVYVSYTEDDQLWVRQYLVPELEGKLRLRLCVKDRDFPPNEPEIHSMERSLDVSKKIVVVFSANYAKDETCLFELALCVRHSMDRGDRPLVLSLHHLASHHMRPSMLAVLKTTDYIQWDGRDDVAASCWGRLRLALHDVMVSRGQRLV